MSGYRIERARADLGQWREVPETMEPGDGEVVARVDVAALTSNNVTYAVHGGPPFNYWHFFPATDGDWGVVPVWGYATVLQSRSPDVPEGSRFFGYWPSASHARLQPGKARGGGFADMAPHRQALAAVYNGYLPAGDTTPQSEQLTALFKPLYGTGFVLAYSLSADAAAGQRILITSASSKTALSTAYNLANQGNRPIGLTSRANLTFVKSTGLYSDVLAYDEVETLDPDVPTILVDFSGNGALKARIHAHARKLLASHIIGDTDWQSPNIAPPTGPAPTPFFAPTIWAARARELGPAVFDAQLTDSLKAFLATTPDWLDVQESRGSEGYAESFRKLLANEVSADVGMVWRP